MTGKLSKNFHGVGIGPLSKILAVKSVSYRKGLRVTLHYQFPLTGASMCRGFFVGSILRSTCSFQITSSTCVNTALKYSCEV